MSFRVRGLIQVLGWGALYTDQVSLEEEQLANDPNNAGGSRLWV